MQKATDLQSRDNNITGIFLMIAGILLISIKDGFTKFLVADYPPIQIVSMSAWIGVGFMVLWSVMNRKHPPQGIRVFATNHWGAHMLRAAIGVLTGLLFLYSLKLLRLVDVTVIFFFAPIVMTLFSAVFLNERVGKYRWFAVITGFIGVVIAIQPGSEGFDWLFVLPLAASITYATRAVLVRRMAGIETATQIVFHTRLGVGLLTLVPLIIFWQPMSPLDFGTLIGLTILQLAAHIFITKSTVTASLTVVGPYEYTGLIWIALIGYIFWGEIPDNNIWIGAFFIIGAGLVVAYREARSAQIKKKDPSKPILSQTGH